MKFALKLCIVNKHKQNRKNIYNNNKATRDTKSYSDLEDTEEIRPSGFLESSTDLGKTVIGRRNIIAALPDPFKLSALGDTHEVQLTALLQRWTPAPYYRIA